MVECFNCAYHFKSQKAKKVCDNCFACLGCEVYVCPKCGSEVEVAPKQDVENIQENLKNPID